MNATVPIAEAPAPPRLGDSPDRPVVCEVDVLEPCLDPIHAYDFVATGIAGLLHDTLFRTDGTAGIASHVSWRGNDWTIELARGRCFGDGREIEAGHFVAAIESLARDGGPLRWLADGIQGFREAAAARRGPVAGVIAVDRHTLAIRTVRPIAYLPETLSAPIFAPRAGDLLAGSGPFRLASALPGARGLILGRDGPSPRARSEGASWLALLRTDDGAQGLRLFADGRLHLTCGTNFPHRRAADPALTPWLQTAPSTLVGQLLPNAARVPALADPAARRALSAAIDRPRLAAVLAPLIDPLDRFAALWGATDAVALADVEAARAWWRQAAMPIRTLEISYANFPPNGELAGMVAEDIERALPLNVSLRRLDYREHVSMLAERRHELAYAIVPAPFDDPAAVLLPFAKGGVLTAGSGQTAPRFLAAFAAAEGIIDRRERRRAMAAAAEVLHETMPVIPLARIRICRLLADAIESAPLLPGGLTDFASIRVRTANG